MKIRIIVEGFSVSLTGLDYHEWPKGSEHDVDEDLGRQLIKGQEAEEIKQTKKAEPAKPVKRSYKRKKPFNPVKETKE